MTSKRTIVYVIGAGASQALSTKVPGMRMGKHLEREVDSKAWTELKVFLRSGGRAQSYDHDDWASLLGEDARLGNIEEMLIAFENYSASVDQAESQRAEKCYEAIRHALGDVFSRLDSEVMPGLPPSPYAHLAGAIKEHGDACRHVFISFNYDIWLEKALREKRIWSPVRGYTNKFALAAYGPSGFSQTRDDEQSSVVVYKPHGSLSILTPVDQPYELQHPIVNLDDSSLEAGYTKGNVAYLPVGTKSLNIRIPGHPQRAYRPFIVPPAKNKVIGGAFLLDVYEGLEAALAEASAIVVVGWSMPDTDSAIRQRMFDAVARTSWKPGAVDKLIVCDVNKTNLFYQRFQASIPARSVILHKEGFGNEFIDQVVRPIWNS